MRRTITGHGSVSFAEFSSYTKVISRVFGAFLHSLFQPPIAALTHGNVLAVVEFALLLGIALVVIVIEIF
ncbi:hypothetical protein [Nitrosomonas aestuarii]|uniref:hypothetical protein n=1 Tax=Nitrosomonas aestuarii TaxID=52441 RepID=UPI001FD2F2F6|nr:hypothetical protein [Nitrosomonas aestuarii]